MSLEMAHKVILPPKKNYIPQFLKQRDINSYYIPKTYDRVPYCKTVRHRNYVSVFRIQIRFDQHFFGIPGF
jgi:hypothetical protein